MNGLWQKLFIKTGKPKASEVLTSYLKQCGEPPWTSYFIKYADIIDDQRGMSHFNWSINHSVPTLLYGISAIFLITHKEVVQTSKGNVPIYFLLRENKGSPH